MSASDHNPGWKALGIIAVIAAICVLGAWGEGMFEGGDGSTTVESLSSSDGAALATQLDKAHDAQGICYGWRLQDSSGSYYSTSKDTISSGSNLGEGRALDMGDLPPECDKAVELVADVTYTSSSSESNDSATLTVNDYNIDLPYDVTTDLARFGVTEKDLINDPVGAAARGVLALPLLMAEYGLAEPLPQPSDTAAAPSGPPAVGSDFLRDRGWLLIAAGALLLCAAVGVFLGFRSRRHEYDRALEAAHEAARQVTRRAEARKRRKGQGSATGPTAVPAQGTASASPASGGQEAADQPANNDNPSPR